MLRWNLHAGSVDCRDKQAEDTKFESGMSEIENQKHYDLEDRSFAFARRVRGFIKKLQRTIANVEDGKQLVRASGSVGANYIEANEALSKKDFIMRIKICRKESKESRYWLALLDLEEDAELEEERSYLIGEANELTRIFSSILQKCR
jgi:four helix bundle protein